MSSNLNRHLFYNYVNFFGEKLLNLSFAFVFGFSAQIRLVKNVEILKK